MNLRTLFIFYVLSLPLLHALSPVPSITLALCFASITLAGALFFIPTATSHLGFQSSDLLFGMVYLLGLVPLLFSPETLGSQNFKYAGLFFFVWLINYWWVREWLNLAKLSMRDVSRFAVLACIVLSASVYVEVLTSNLFGMYWSDFIPFSIREFPQATILGSSFQRPRVFSSEAGFTSIAYECLLPLAFINLARNHKRAILFLGLVLPAYVVLGSASSFVGFAIVLWTYSFLVKRASAGAWFMVAAVVAVVGFIMLTEHGQYLYSEIIGRKLDNLWDTGEGTETEAFGRREAYIFGFHILSNNLFGIGWGAVSQAYQDSGRIYGQFVASSGLISLFLEVAVACGVFGFAITIFAIVKKLVELARSNSIETHAVYFSLLWVTLHHFFVFEFWFPMIWFSFAVADHAVRLERYRTAYQPMSYSPYPANRRHVQQPPRIPLR